MRTRPISSLIVFILLSFASCGQRKGGGETIMSSQSLQTELNGAATIDSSSFKTDYSDENVWTMNINGQDWKADRIEQNIILPTEEIEFYDIYVGGGGDLDGFSIRIEVDENHLHNLKGRYPIYNFYTHAESGQVYLLPNFSDFTYYNESYKDESLDKRMVIGYLEIKTAKLESSENKLWYSKLSGSFDAQFNAEMDGGKMKEVTITNGYFHVNQAERSD